MQDESSKMALALTCFAAAFLDRTLVGAVAADQLFVHSQGSLQDGVIRVAVIGRFRLIGTDCDGWLFIALLCR